MLLSSSGPLLFPYIDTVVRAMGIAAVPIAVALMLWDLRCAQGAAAGDAGSSGARSR